MSDLEIFEHRVALFNTILTAHLARCIDKVGLLDADTHSSITHHMRDLSRVARRLECVEASAWIDLLGEILPSHGTDLPRAGPADRFRGRT